MKWSKDFPCILAHGWLEAVAGELKVAESVFFLE